MQDLRPDPGPIPPPGPTPAPATPPVVEIAVPVHNEEHVLGPSIERLHELISLKFT